MKRDKGNQESRAHQGRGTDLVVEDGCDDDKLEGPGPEEVIEQDGRVKPTKTLITISKGSRVVSAW